MAGKNTTREKILQAALDFIAVEGAERLTTRKIAELAGVNAASTNYHFRSKEALVEEALVLFMERISAVFSYLEDKTLPPEKRAFLFVKGYLEKLLEYPGVLKTQVMMMLSSKEVLPRFLNSKAWIYERFVELVPPSPGKPSAPRFVEIMAAVVYPVLTPQYVLGYSGIDLTKEEDRDLYVRTILRDLLDMNY